MLIVKLACMLFRSLSILLFVVLRVPTSTAAKSPILNAMYARVSAAIPAACTVVVSLVPTGAK